ncbi:MAG TPA: 30S ribosome-binding factor RbfA [Sandaracinaceae bacterium LLY-WYZ-13_1]|nr:30S ribosome-binding factor RbfA [Sandaracinaceae bacterium LLY-WYZ-13_1]
MAEGDRAQRVGERIRQELMELLLMGKVKDPGTRGAMVHGVRVSNDLSHARIYVRLDEPNPSEARRRALLRGLKRASGFLRREVGRRLRIRRAPELHFHWDDTAEKARRIESLLEEIRHEDEGEP